MTKRTAIPLFASTSPIIKRIKPIPNIPLTIKSGTPSLDDSANNVIPIIMRSQDNCSKMAPFLSPFFHLTIKPNRYPVKRWANPIAKAIINTVNACSIGSRILGTFIPAISRALPQ
ncbi:115aa long hypothetical protein [Pyrococcus horikoshii OT3]|uniref:Uncharacterized protein n=1 Tax=Pyrococcus horikoshii (strain ATCC 700860 / DSM 12428 / JCM 9974 / NBRC 100139 / OT-3) TaxID=70601 RepID=O57722_PYRHO|nr:115aa long hypothetical protein [Pyrococcus horikoshii OT3]